MEIKEFKYDYIYYKFKSEDNDYLTRQECKNALLFASGLKISKKILPEKISLIDFKILYNKYLYLDFSSIYENLKSGENFQSKVKQYFPNLSNNFILECYNTMCNVNINQIINK